MLVIGNRDFSVGVLQGWHGVLLGLLASAVFLVGGRQDVGPGLGMASSAFWFALALASAIGVVWLGIGAGIWAGALLGLGALCSEVCLIQRWWRLTKKPGSQKGN